MINKETYEATVTANNDDEQRGRIRVACVGLLGDEEADLPMWVEPVPDWGWFYIPDVGEVIEIEVTTSSSMDENPEQMSIDNLDVKWKGGRYFGNDEGDDPTIVNAVFTSQNYGKRRGFATPFGHTFVFDDTEGSQQIILSWVKSKLADAPTELSQLIFEADGTMKLSVLGKNTIHLKENELEMKLDEGATLKMTGKDGSTQTVIGDGAVHPAIAEHLETFYGTLKSFIEGAIVQTSMGPSSTILVGSGPAPTWDGSINSTKVEIPDG